MGLGVDMDGSRISRPHGGLNLEPFGQQRIAIRTAVSRPTLKHRTRAKIIIHEQTHSHGAQIWRGVSLAKLTAAVHLPRYVLIPNPRRRRIITWPTSYCYSRPISVPRELWLQHAVPHYEHYGPATTSRTALPDEVRQHLETAYNHFLTYLSTY